MVYAIIALSLTVLILLLLILARRGYGGFVPREICSKEGVERNIKNLAQSLRMPKRGGPPLNVSVLKSDILRAHKQLRTRVLRDQEIFDFEKWIYENHYHVINRLSAREYDDFTQLPACEGKQRILYVAELIVELSEGKPTQKIIRDTLREFNKYTPLYYEEMRALERAIAYVLCARVAEICKKSLRFEKMRRRALRSRSLDSKYAVHDSYVYFSLQYGAEKGAVVQKKFADINLENAELAFFMSLSESLDKVSNAIGGIRESGHIMSAAFLNEITYAGELMAKDAVYREMDELSRQMYMKAVGEWSTRLNVSEKNVLEAVFKLAESEGVHFGNVLLEDSHRLRAYMKSGNLPKEKRTRRRESQFYILGILVIDLALSLIGALFFRTVGYKVAVFLLGFVLYFKIAELIINQIAAKTLQTRPLPRMNHAELPDSGKTVVVVSRLVAGKEDLKEALFHIKKIAATNGGKNIEFALLLDYAPHIEEFAPVDAELNRMLEVELSNCRDIRAYVRGRTFDGVRYSAHERKRGAILAFNEMLVSGDTSKFTFVSKKAEKPEFVMVLDADTELMPGMVKNAVNTMLHPANRAFDLLSFRGRYNLKSLKTFYSKRYRFASGKEGYCQYSDLYFNLTGQSVFCGKGIYRLGAFYEKLNHLLPEGKILSHDILEGAILHTGSFNQEIYEDAPESFLQDVERTARWQRGDVQLLPFIKDRYKNKDGEQIIIKKSLIYKYILFSNVAAIWLPIAQFGLLLAYLITGNPFFLLPGIFSFLIPFAFEAVAISGRSGNGMRVRYAVEELWFIVCRTVFDVFMMPFFAVQQFVLFFKTLFRMAISKKNLLSWRTFGAARGQGGLKDLSIFWLPFLVMLALSGIFYTNTVLHIYTVLFYIAAFYITFAGISRRKKDVLGEAEREKLLQYAEKTYGYFEELANEENHHLIPDNYQISPFKGSATQTSPTNLGFQMVSYVAAAELGIVRHIDALKHMTDLYESIKTLKKYKGNLYNWYDVKSKKILNPKVVSSVDSANFIACLIVCKQYLIKNHSYLLADKLEKLIEKTDLTFFLDQTTGLFYIAYDVERKKFSGHYDLLASESRLLAYIAVAKGANVSVWDTLSRFTVSYGGNTLLSWSGTAFEYLLPGLFLREQKEGLLGTSVFNAVRMQIKNRCKGLFGISESAYYRFDDGLRYQYYAFGVEELALRAEQSRCVISPYSSFLALPYAPKQVARNLESLKQEGLVGRFGFFEAVDFTKGKNIVYSHMAHHEGMSLCAAANFLKDGCIQNLFMSDARMAGCELLLSERKVRSESPKIYRGEFLYQSRESEQYSRTLSLAGFPDTGMLAGDHYRVLMDDHGCGYAATPRQMITRFKKDIYKTQGIFAYFKDEQGLFSPTFAPLKDAGAQYKVEHSHEKLVYRNETKQLQMEVFLPHGIHGEVRKFRLNNEEKIERAIDFSMFADLSMNTYEGDYSHKVFDNMFIHTGYLPEYTAIVAERKPRGRGGSQYAAMVLCGVDDVLPETNKFNYIGRLRSEADPQIFDHKPSEISLGDVLEPCFGFLAKVRLAPSRKNVFYVSIVCDESYDGLMEQIKRVSDVGYLRNAELALSMKQQANNKAYLQNKKQSDSANILAAKLLYQPYSKESLQNMHAKNSLAHIESLGLNKFVKSLYLDLAKTDVESIRDAVHVLAFLNYAGIECNLIVAENDAAKTAEKKNTLKKAAEVLGCMDRIAFLNIDHDRLFAAEVKAACFDVIGGGPFVSQPTISHLKVKKPTKPEACKSKMINSDLILKSGAGGFDAEGDYIVRSKKPTLLPQSNVVCGEYGGFVATENGGGYTYALNSRENKLTEFVNSPVDDAPSEAVYLKEQDFIWRINKGFGQCAYTKHSKGETLYKMHKFGLESAVRIGLIKQGRAKVYQISVKNETERKRQLELLFCMKPALFWRGATEYIYTEEKDGMLLVVNALTGQKCWLKFLADARYYDDRAKLLRRDTVNGVLTKGAKSSFYNPAAGGEVALDVPAYSEKHIAFVLGADEQTVRSVHSGNLAPERQKMLDYFKNLNKIELSEVNKPLSTLFNHWLMYQTVSSRFNGRCAYYQAGGAIGFRDQLQDCLAILYSDPEAVRRHILLSAAHQFEEGDVQHWWHPPYYGVRTRITDDMLFLPFVTCRYMQATGDMSILEEKIPFLTGPKPAENQESLFYAAQVSEEKATLFEHLMRAVKVSLQFGEHGLLLIGGGDWNDALNDIGMHGRGESVWLTMFAHMVIKQMIPYMDTEDRLHYVDVTAKMQQAIQSTFENGRFKRAFTDEGVWLGSDSSPVCSVDILTQCFALISGTGTPAQCESALKYAFKLVDEEVGIIQLLDPPFDRAHYAGYISAYPEGMRENGGQYTHAAAWFIKALALNGQLDLAYDLLCKINPIEKCMTVSGARRYQGEPYVLAGDVYTHKDHYGRMGWSWYTGSAAWMYTVILEDLLGLQFKNGALSVRGSVPKALKNANLVFRYRSSYYKIKFIPATVNALFINGIEVSDQGEMAIPLYDNNKAYKVEIFHDDIDIEYKI